MVFTQSSEATLSPKIINFVSKLDVMYSSIFQFQSSLSVRQLSTCLTDDRSYRVDLVFKG